MNINAETLGQIYLIWTPLYLLACFLMVRIYRLSSPLLFVSILLVPFLPLTPIFLIVITALCVSNNRILQDKVK